MLAALPPALRDAPARAGQRFHLDVPGWFRETAPPPWLTELARAVWRDRVVELRYRRGDREVTRRVQPYGLVLKSGVWYLVGRVGDDMRTYRVDRVTGVEVGEESFDRDEGFDLAGHWREQAGSFLRTMLRAEVTVRLSPAGLRQLRHLVDAPFVYDELVAAAGAPDGQGWVVAPAARRVGRGGVPPTAGARPRGGGPRPARAAAVVRGARRPARARSTGSR